MDRSKSECRSFSKNRLRLLVGETAKEVFAVVVEQAPAMRLLSNEHFTADGTLIGAWVSHKSFLAIYQSVVTQATRAEEHRPDERTRCLRYNDMKGAALFGRAIALMGFVSQLVRRDAVSWLREVGKRYGSRSKFDRPHQQLPCQILPREASAVRLRSYPI